MQFQQIVRFCVVVGLVVAVLGSPRPADAHARWVTSADGSGRVAHARLALAVSSDWTTVWMSFDIDAEAASGALVLPVPLGAELDLVSDAWLSALESATAIRVLPPVVPAVPECGGPVSPVHDTAPSWSEPSAAPASMATFSAADELLAHAEERGWRLSPEDVEDLTRSDPATAFIALGYDLPAEPITTQTVRLRKPGAAPTLFLRALRRATDQPLELTVWTFGPGRARLSGLSESSGEELDVTWLSARATSDYLEQARALLESYRGRGALLECAGTDPLYSHTVLPGGGGIEPVARRYLTLASELGDTAALVDVCLDAVSQARASAVAISELDAAALRCGGADELAHALTGLAADEATVTRHRLLVGDDTPVETRVSWDGGSQRPPVVRADLLDVTGCVVSEPEVYGGGSGGASNTGSGGSAPYIAPTTHVSSEAESEVYTDTSITCAGSSEPGPEPEWWEESSQGDDEATCSGDSTESSASSHESCSGDSSDSEGYDEATCAGDSTELDSGDDTCSGDSTDYEGDYETCSAARRRAGRPRLSALLFGWVAVLLPLRRRLRRRRYRDSQASVST